MCFTELRFSMLTLFSRRHSRYRSLSTPLNMSQFMPDATIVEFCMTEFIIFNISSVPSGICTIFFWPYLPLPPPQQSHLKQGSWGTSAGQLWFSAFELRLRASNASNPIFNDSILIVLTVQIKRWVHVSENALLLKNADLRSETCSQVPVSHAWELQSIATSFCRFRANFKILVRLIWASVLWVLTYHFKLTKNACSISAAESGRMARNRRRLYPLGSNPYFSALIRGKRVGGGMWPQV